MKVICFIAPFILACGVDGPLSLGNLRACPEGEACAPGFEHRMEELAGLYGRSNELTPGADAIDPTMVGSFQVLTLKHEVFADSTVRFTADVQGPAFAITDLTPPHVTVAARELGRSTLRVRDPAGRLIDEVDLRSDTLSDIQVATLARDGADGWFEAAPPFVIDRGRSVGLAVLLVPARGLALVDGGLAIDGATQVGTNGVRVDATADVTLTVTPTAGAPARFVIPVAQVATIVRSSPSCFRALDAAGRVVTGAEWRFSGAPVTIDPVIPDCFWLDNSARGTIEVTADGVVATFPLPLS
jgi:hypothetical protein